MFVAHARQALLPDEAVQHDSVVAGVRYPQAFARDLGAFGVIQLAALRSGRTCPQDTLRTVVPVQDDDAVVVFIGKIDPAARVDGEVLRLIEPELGATDSSHEAEVAIQDLQPVVARIGNHDAAIGRRLDIMGAGILIGVAAASADFSDDRAISDLHHVVARGAGHVNRPVGGDIDPFRRAQRAADVVDEHACGAVHPIDGNAMVVGIGNQQASPLVEGRVMRAG